MPSRVIAIRCIATPDIAKAAGSHADHPWPVHLWHDLPRDHQQRAQLRCCEDRRLRGVSLSSPVFPGETVLLDV